MSQSSLVQWRVNQNFFFLFLTFFVPFLCTSHLLSPPYVHPSRSFPLFIPPFPSLCTSLCTSLSSPPAVHPSPPSVSIHRWQVSSRWNSLYSYRILQLHTHPPSLMKHERLDSQPGCSCLWETSPGSCVPHGLQASVTINSSISDVYKTGLRYVVDVPANDQTKYQPCTIQLSLYLLVKMLHDL